MDDQRAIRRAFAGFRATLAAQVTVLLLGVARAIAMPKILSVEDYAYWQVYVLYSTYVGVFSLGYNDGIYLVYGGFSYEDLPFRVLRKANRFYLCMLALCTVAAVAACFVVPDPARRFSLLGVSVDIFLVGSNGLLISVLQITDQMEAYARYSVLDRAILLLAVAAAVFLPNVSFRFLVAADVCGRGAVSVCLLARCRKLFWGQAVPLKDGFGEFAKDIRIGVSLLIANLMSMLITGIGRMIVDQFGDLREYAYYSFGITVTNLVLVFINAVSLVLYPALKRMSSSDHQARFVSLSAGLRIFGAFGLTLYFPAALFIRWFLPRYEPIFPFLHILFGVIAVQSKLSLLTNTFYKVLREEKALLRANMMCVGLFLLLALPSFFLTHSLISIAVCTLAAMLIRCVLSERFLRVRLHIPADRMAWVETAYLLLYVLAVTVLPFHWAALVCLGMTAAALALDREGMAVSLAAVRGALRR